MKVPNVCTGKAEHQHHKILRSQGGTNHPLNLLPVCLRCHDHIHKHPQEAKELGWIVVLQACETCGQRFTADEWWTNRAAVGLRMSHVNCPSGTTFRWYGPPGSQWACPHNVVVHPCKVCQEMVAGG